MKKPIVGVIGNSYSVEDRYQTQLAGESNLSAIADVSGALPLIFAGTPDVTDIDDLLNAVDGIVLTGARANVHPTNFETEADEAYEPYDERRDRLALSLSKACVERGVPLFGICRGMQEINVAFGGSLHPEIRDIPGRMNHRMPPDGTLEEKFALRHPVTFTEGGPFHRLMGATEVMTNTLHGQGIEQAGDRIVVDGRAEDGTPEAIYIEGAKGFALSVQWHPEYKAAQNPDSVKLFEAFGAAARARHARRTGQAMDPPMRAAGA